MSTLYGFKASGKTPDGNKFTATGEITGPDMEDSMPPFSVAEAARAEVEKVFKGCTMTGDDPAKGLISYPTVWRIKNRKA